MLFVIGVPLLAGGKSATPANPGDLVRRFLR